MKKQNRILKNQDFIRIIKRGKKIHSPIMTFYFLENNLTHRIGISVSKKITKLAVDRNKIKRRIIASLNLNPVKKNLDIVIIAKKEINDKNFWDINKEINIFIKKINERRCNEG